MTRLHITREHTHTPRLNSLSRLVALFLLIIIKSVERLTMTLMFDIRGDMYVCIFGTRKSRLHLGFKTLHH